MSAPASPADRSGAPRTVPAIRGSKVSEGAAPLVMVTAYDAPGARVADAADVDMILVGDSVAMVVLGYEDTLQVTVDDPIPANVDEIELQDRRFQIGDDDDDGDNDNAPVDDDDDEDLLDDKPLLRSSSDPPEEL